MTPAIDGALVFGSGIVAGWTLKGIVKNLREISRLRREIKVVDEDMERLEEEIAAIPPLTPEDRARRAAYFASMQQDPAFDFRRK